MCNGPCSSTKVIQKVGSFSSCAEDIRKAVLPDELVALEWIASQEAVNLRGCPARLVRQWGSVDGSNKSHSFDSVEHGRDFFRGNKIPTRHEEIAEQPKSKKRGLVDFEAFSPAQRTAQSLKPRQLNKTAPTDEASTVATETALSKLSANVETLGDGGRNKGPRKSITRARESLPSRKQSLPSTQTAMQQALESLRTGLESREEGMSGQVTVDGSNEHPGRENDTTCQITPFRQIASSKGARHGNFEPTSTQELFEAAPSFNETSAKDSKQKQKQKPSKEASFALSPRDDTYEASEVRDTNHSSLSGAETGMTSIFRTSIFGRGIDCSKPGELEVDIDSVVEELRPLLMTT